jgi:hypothetical protein
VVQQDVAARTNRTAALIAAPTHLRRAPRRPFSIVKRCARSRSRLPGARPDPHLAEGGPVLKTLIVTEPNIFVDAPRRRRHHCRPCSGVSPRFLRIRRAISYFRWPATGRLSCRKARCGPCRLDCWAPGGGCGSFRLQTQLLGDRQVASTWLRPYRTSLYIIQIMRHLDSALIVLWV